MTKPVPPVDPEHLRLALVSIARWLDGGEVEDAREETIDGCDLNHILDSFVAMYGVDAPGAVALFKRAIALHYFCSENELPENLFADGWPGRALCTAAARVPVLDIEGSTEDLIGHSFDPDQLHTALRSANN